MIYLFGYLAIAIVTMTFFVWGDKDLKRKEIGLVAFFGMIWPIVWGMEAIDRTQVWTRRLRRSAGFHRWCAWWDQPLRNAKAETPVEASINRYLTAAQLRTLLASVEDHCIVYVRVDGNDETDIFLSDESPKLEIAHNRTLRNVDEDYLRLYGFEE